MSVIDYDTKQVTAVSLTAPQEGGESDSPAYRSHDWQEMSPYWTISIDTWEATRTMRRYFGHGRAEHPYLLRKPREKQAEYNERILRAVMPEWIKKTVDTFSGMAFIKEPSYQGNNEQIAEWLTDVTGTGVDLGQFCRDALQISLLYGHVLIVPDMPSLTVEISLEQQRQQAIRPFLKSLPPSCLINWSWETIGGRKMLRHATIMEQFYGSSGEFGEKLVTEYRAFFRQQGGGVTWRLYRDEKNAISGTGSIPVLQSSGVLPSGIDEIPIFPAYSNKVNDLMSYPALLGMSYDVIKWYQLDSDIDNAIGIMCFPPLAMTGWMDVAQKDVQGALTWGPHQAFFFESGGGMQFAEIQGGGLKIAMENKAEVQKRIAEAALKLMNANNVNDARTATEVMADQMADASTMISMLMSLENALNKAFDAIWTFFGIGEPDMPIEISKEVQMVTLSPQEIDARLKLWLADAMSYEEFINGLIKGGVINEDFDIEAQAQKLMTDRTTAERQGPVIQGREVV